MRQNSKLVLIGAGVYAYGSKDKFPPPGVHIYGPEPSGIKGLHTPFMLQGLVDSLHCLIHAALFIQIPTQERPAKHQAQRYALCSHNAAQ